MTLPVVPPTSSTTEPAPGPTLELTPGDPPIRLTERAIEMGKKRLVEAQEDTPELVLGLRLGVKGGGCSGLMYDLTFDDQMKDGDKVFEDNGVKVGGDKKSLLYLLGTTLDFSGGLNGKGFQFVNPNASRTCGCGESFSI